MTDAAPSYPAFGLASPANLLTLSRVVLSPLLFWLIFEAEPQNGTSWRLVILGALFAATDTLDGRIARSSGHVSRSGAFLDPLADKIVVIGCLLSYVAIGRIHWLPVALIAVRELWISLVRIHWAQLGRSMPARRSAKYKTALQGMAIMLLALPPLKDQPWIADTFLWFVVAFTLFTGWQYLRDGRSATNLTG